MPLLVCCQVGSSVLLESLFSASALAMVFVGCGIVAMVCLGCVSGNPTIGECR